jgi:uncharacterized membrane protein (UPF0136 family)
MAGADLTNLQTYRTPKERLRSAFWALLGVLVSGALSWDLLVYSIKFWESGRASGLIIPAFVAVVLIWTLRLLVRASRHSWPIVPAIVAAIAVIALHLMEQPVQPNSRFLGDAYESALSRSSSSAPKPER